jgi:hypothetical protein
VTPTVETRPLLISELIKLLQAAEQRHGDRPVYAESPTEISAVLRLAWDVFTEDEGKVIVLVAVEDQG